MGRLNGAAAWRRLDYVAVLVVAALPRLWSALFDHGMVWPDEIFQSLEPAHRAVFGYGIEAWELDAGTRSWLLPGVAAMLLKAMATLGVESSIALVTGVKLAMAGVSLLGVYGTMRLAEAFDGRPAGVLAGLLAAAFPLTLVFASRSIGDSVSATLLVFSLLLVARPPSSRPLLAGALGGAAVFVKFQNGLVLAAVFVLLALARRRGELRAWLLGALGAALLFGVFLDAVTWGSPFHSFRTYIEYNVFRDQSAKYGTQGPLAYAVWAWWLTGPALLAIAVGLLLALGRMAGIVLVALFFVGVHVAIPHKELRFLLPVVPLLLAAAGVGLAAGIRRLRLSPVLTPLLGVALAAAMAQRAAGATYAHIGQYVPYPAGAVPVWHAMEGPNRLLALTGERADACGVWVAGIRVPYVGGYTYLHRDIPILWGAWPYASLFANYLVMPATPVPPPLATRAADTLAAPPAGFVPVARSYGWTLLRRPGGCAPAPPQIDDRRIYD